MGWRLIGADGRAYESAEPGTFGGHRGTRIYGRLDCPSALRALARAGKCPSILRPFDPSTSSGQAQLRAGQAQGSPRSGRVDSPRSGGYRENRVFFADEATAIAAGYRPCAVCLPEQYGEWRRR
jgi:hypothetical protein